ncbi:MAG: hypothetical protein AAFV49_18550 [Pseudomonadota bacterium]
MLLIAAAQTVSPPNRASVDERSFPPSFAIRLDLFNERPDRRASDAPKLYAICHPVRTLSLPRRKDEARPPPLSLDTALDGELIGCLAEQMLVVRERDARLFVCQLDGEAELDDALLQELLQAMSVNDQGFPHYLSRNIIIIKCGRKGAAK